MNILYLKYNSIHIYKSLTLILFIVTSFSLNAQSPVTAVFDTKNLFQLQKNQEMRMLYQGFFNDLAKKTNSNYTKSETNLASFLIAKNRVYDALFNVNSLFRQGKHLQRVGELTVDIADELNLLSREITKSPEYAVFIKKYLQNTTYQLSGIVSEVSDIVLGDKRTGVMIDPHERDAILSSIEIKLKLISANLYLMRNQIQYAKIDGFWKNANPFKDWINQDKRMVEDIIRRSKYL